MPFLAGDTIYLRVPPQSRNRRPTAVAEQGGTATDDCPALPTLKELAACQHDAQTSRGSNGTSRRISCKKCKKLLLFIHNDVNKALMRRALNSVDAAACDDGDDDDDGGDYGFECVSAPTPLIQPNDRGVLSSMMIAGSSTPLIQPNDTCVHGPAPLVDTTIECTYLNLGDTPQSRMPSSRTQSYLFTDV